MSPARQTGVWLVVALAAVLFLALFQDILLPFVAGIAIAYFLDPLVDRLERRGVGRTAGALLVLAGFSVASFGVLLLLVPVVNAQLAGLVASLPGYIETLEHAVARVMARVQAEVSPEDMEGIRRALTGHLGTAAGWAGEVAGRVLGSGLAIVNLLGLAIVTPVVAFYLLRDWDRIVSAVDGLLPRRSAPVIREQAARIDTTLAGFVRGQATVCIVLGLCYGCLLMLAGLDFGFIVGIFSGLVSFIPYVGSVLGGLISIGLALDQFDSLWRVALVALIFVAGQAVEGNYLTPKLVGDRVGLHPVWVIFALFAGGSLLGFVGMLVALPAAAAIGVLARFAIEQYRESRLYGSDDAP